MQSITYQGVPLNTANLTGLTNNYITGGTVNQFNGDTTFNYNLSGGFTVPSMPSVYSVKGSNILFIDGDNGSDTTGTKGRMDLPYKSFRAALTAATDGDLIYVWPKFFSYTLTSDPLTGPGNLYKKNISWYFSPGTTIRQSGTTPTSVDNIIFNISSGLVDGYFNVFGNLVYEGTSAGADSSNGNYRLLEATAGSGLRNANIYIECDSVKTGAGTVSLTSSATATTQTNNLVFNIKKDFINEYRWGTGGGQSGSFTLFGVFGGNFYWSNGYLNIPSDLSTSTGRILYQGGGVSNFDDIIIDDLRTSDSTLAQFYSNGSSEINMGDITYKNNVAKTNYPLFRTNSTSGHKLVIDDSRFFVNFSGSTYPVLNFDNFSNSRISIYNSVISNQASVGGDLVFSQGSNTGNSIVLTNSYLRSTTGSVNTVNSTNTGTNVYYYNSTINGGSIVSGTTVGTPITISGMTFFE